MGEVVRHGSGDFLHESIHINHINLRSYIPQIAFSAADRIPEQHCRRTKDYSDASFRVPQKKQTTPMNHKSITKCTNTLHILCVDWIKCQ